MAFPQRQSHIVKQKTGPDDPELQASLQEALSKVSPDDVIAIADELAARRTRYFTSTSAADLPLGEVAAAVTHTKANARTVAAYFAQRDYGPIAELLNGSAPAPERVSKFADELTNLDTRLALEVATGLLHNTAPHDHWLWTRWLWDPTTGTGILPLLAGSVHNLVATNLADGYAQVGAVTAMSIKFAEASGLWTDVLAADEQRAAFANSAFLACAYGVYMYGSTAWRLNRDFNDLLPSLPNMARRLLGLPKAASGSQLTDEQQGDDS